MSRHTEGPRGSGSDGGAFRRVLRRHGLWAVNVLGVAAGGAQAFWGPSAALLDLLGALWAPRFVLVGLTVNVAVVLAGLPDVVRSLRGTSGDDS